MHAAKSTSKLYAIVKRSASQCKRQNDIVKFKRQNDIEENYLLLAIGTVILKNISWGGVWRYE